MSTVPYLCNFTFSDRQKSGCPLEVFVPFTTEKGAMAALQAARLSRELKVRIKMIVPEVVQQVTAVHLKLLVRRWHFTISARGTRGAVVYKLENLRRVVPVRARCCNWNSPQERSNRRILREATAGGIRKKRRPYGTNLRPRCTPADVGCRRSCHGDPPASAPLQCRPGRGWNGIDNAAVGAEDQPY